MYYWVPDQVRERPDERRFPGLTRDPERRASMVPVRLSLSPTPPADLIGVSITHEMRQGTRAVRWMTAGLAASALTDCTQAQDRDGR